jgi:hypothetical protein
MLNSQTARHAFIPHKTATFKTNNFFAGFEGDLAIHVTNESACHMVFTSSADFEGGKIQEEEEDVKFNLWSFDYCALTHWLYDPWKKWSEMWEKSFKKLSTDKGHNYQGEPAFSPDGVEVAFVQTMPVEFK